ncbi:MAG: hypothetical protein PGN34_20580 [Methylobacterium frigidaeris]
MVEQIADRARLLRIAVEGVGRRPGRRRNIEEVVVDVEDRRDTVPGRPLDHGLRMRLAVAAEDDQGRPETLDPRQNGRFLALIRSGRAEFLPDEIVHRDAPGLDVGPQRLDETQLKAGDADIRDKQYALTPGFPSLPVRIRC